MTGPTLPPLAGTATLDITDFRRGTRGALSALREVVDYSRRNSTLTLTARLAGATPAALKGQITNALGTAPLKLPITLDPASINAALTALRAQLSGVVSINTSTLTTVQGQINTQIAQLTALIAQLRALGGGGAGGAGGATSRLSASTQALLADLAKLNNEYKRGDITAATYGARLLTLQGSLRAAAGAAAAGGADFRALDTAVTRTVQGLRNIETAKVLELRTQLQGARSAFDAAAAAATTLAQKQAAIATYTAEVSRARVALQGLASSGTLTAQQLGAVNSMLGQTARELNTIQGRVNIRSLSGNISNAVQQLVGMVPGAAQLTSVMGGLPAPILAAAAAAGVLATQLGAAFRTAADFQQRMVDIKALTQPTAEEFARLSDAALNSGVSLGVGAREAAAAILELNRAGLSAQDVIGTGLTATLNLAAAAGISTSEAGKLAAASMTAFKLSGQDLPRIADNFSNFANSTVLAAEDLSQAIAAVGPTAVSSGLSIEQFAGIMVTAAKGGFRSMQDAGTSLKTALLALQSPTDQAAAVMDDLQLSVYDAEGNLRPFLTVIDELRTKLSSLTEQERNAKLKTLFGQDAIRIAQILYASTNDEIQRNIDLQGKAGEAARVANERLDSYNGAVKQLGAAWESFQATVGDKLLPSMTQVVFLLSGTLQIIKENTDAIGKYGGAIQRALGFMNPLKPLLNIAKTLRAPYQQIEDEQKAFYERMEKMAKEYEGKSGRLGIAQANYLRGVIALQKAQEGVKTGVNPLTGETLRTVNTVEVEVATQNLVKLREELNNVRTAAEKHGSIQATPGGVGASPEQVKKRTEALAKLREELGARAAEVNLGGLTELDGAIQKVKDAYKKMGEEAAKAFRGNPQNAELLKAQAQLEAQQAQEITQVRREFARKQADERGKEAKQAAQLARDFAFATQRAEIEAMEEGRAKVQAQRGLELAELQRNIAQKVAELAKYPKLQAQAEQDGRRQVQSLQKKWAQEDQRDARERAARIAQAFSDAQAAQAAAQAAARDVELARYELDTARRLATFKDNTEETLRIEQEAIGKRADMVEDAARKELAEQKRQIIFNANQRLAASGLSAREQQEIVRKAYEEMTALDRKYTAGNIKRVQDREQAERDAAEKIRQARIAAAFRPAEDTQGAIRDLEQQQQLLQSTADRLAAQKELTRNQALYAQQLRDGLSSAQALSLTDKERKEKTDELKDAQLNIVKSQQQEIDLARQLVQEARDVEGAYTRISLLLTDPAGVRAQQDLALATQDVADAYAEATPYLQRFRTASLKPQEFDAAKTALEGLIAALERQQQKLETLRGEYDRQRTALQGIQDVLRGFGQEFGDMNLLNSAVQFNQGTYDQAQRALNQLLQGGAYDAAQLADATQKLQAAYGGLKDSVVAVGDAQASVFEKEARAIQSATDTKLKAIDAQLARAREAGDEGLAKSLQAERDRIAQEAEAQVAALEARAEAARKAAQQALTDRTKGLQQTLTGVAQGAQAAQKGVQDLGGQVQQAERDVQGSAQRIRNSLSGAFTGLPGVAATAGRDAGQAFMQAFQTQLTAARLPALTVNPRSAAGAGDTYVTNLYLNGSRAAAPQDIQQLARDLTPLIRAEAQRRNPGGPCGGTR